ncbi:hypothetical protein KPL71_004225 [Citrus sinensis]|uniref:Uncharacterized protein n=1 Tax=Citrus sinensis TaxID=2711 RepID=A0ACB8N452_CITSI|nr:hypothetical protein KPL71_004225 [Citrus sinensis]
MITFVHTERENLPIQAFNDQGFPIYPVKLHGHFLWDVPASGNCDAGCPCWEDIEEDDDEPKRRKRKSKKIIYLACRYHAAHPEDPSEPDSQAPLPIYDKGLAWIRKYEPALLSCRLQSTHETTHVSPTPKIQSCMMFSPSTSIEYQAQFPPLEKHTNQQKNFISKPYVPSAVTPAGHLEEHRSFEAVLNWKTQNVVEQNHALTTLHHKVDHITHKTNQVEKKVDTISDKLNHIYQNLHNRVTQLDSKLRAMLAQQVYSPDFDKKKKAEVRALKAEIARIDSEMVQPTLFTSSAPLPVINLTYHPFLPSFSSRTYEPSNLFEKQPMSQYSAQQLSHSPSLDFSTENSPSQSDSSSIENQETGETGESSQSIPPQPKVSKPSNGPWFTFDDIPPTKWRERLQELSAWIDLQMLAPDATTQSVLREFSTRFTGSLRDLFDSLGQYRQLQFIQISDVSMALAILHDQFIGEPSATFDAARRDYLNMKCCSLNTKDLHYHYKRMSLLYYKLNGFNDPTLRHVFLASLPEELQPEIQRQLAAHRLNIDALSLGKLFQIALGCLDKLCEQKKFFQELIKDKTNLSDLLAKSLTWLSSANIQRSVTASRPNIILSVCARF